MGNWDDAIGSAIPHAHNTRNNNLSATPPVLTPQRSATPPPATERKRLERKDDIAGNDAGSRGGRGKPGAESIDPNALSKALLKEFEEGGRPRQVTPGGSPSRKRQRVEKVYGDR